MLCKTTSIVAIIISCDKLAFPIIAPNEMRTAAAQKSATIKLYEKHNLYPTDNTHL